MGGKQSRTKCHETVLCLYQKIFLRMPSTPFQRTRKKNKQVIVLLAVMFYDILACCREHISKDDLHQITVPISVQELKRQMKNKARLFRAVLLITVLAGALRIYAAKRLFGYGDEPTYMKVAVNYANILRSGQLRFAGFF